MGNWLGMSVAECHTALERKSAMPALHQSDFEKDRVLPRQRKKATLPKAPREEAGQLL